MRYGYNDGGIEVFGDQLLLKKLQKLKQMNSRQGQINAAFNRASKPLRQRARSNAKQFKKTGTLWKSIKMLRSRRFKSLFWVGPARGFRQTYDAWYGYFLEKGTKLRTTRSVPRRGRGRIRANKYMERAYMATKNQVRYGIIKELNILIKKIAQ